MAANNEMVELGKTQIREIARCMWEIQGETASRIAKKCGVHERTIEKWKKKYNWLSKGVQAPKVEALTRDKFLGLLAEKGLPPEKATELLIEGITKPMQDQVAITDPKTDKTKIIFEGTPDYKARHKYFHDYLALTGLVGNSKGIEVNNNGEGSVNIQVNLPAKS